jgi:excisionase family DNA binding protein
MIFLPSSANRQLENSWLLNFIQQGGGSSDLSAEEVSFLDYLRTVEENPPLPPLLLSGAELATLLGVTYYEVKQWIDTGHLPAKKLVGSGHYRIRLEEIEPFLREFGFNAFLWALKNPPLTVRRG